MGQLRLLAACGDGTTMLSPISRTVFLSRLFFACIAWFSLVCCTGKHGSQARSKTGSVRDSFVWLPTK